MALKRRHFLALGLLPLAGCGFHLRGSPSAEGGERAELGRVFVDAEPGSQLAPTLRERLRLRGAQLVAATDAPDLRVEIVSEHAGRRALAIDNSGKVDEYELSLTVKYQVQRRGEETGEVEELRQARSYRFEQSEVLGADAEAEVLHVELREALASSLVLRLSRL